MKFVTKRRIEAVIFLSVCGILFGYLVQMMGISNLLSTIMKTAHDLLLNTVFYIMAIAVLAGALGKILTEFGVVRLLEMIVSPFMKPIFNLPGVAALGGLLSFLSDNPAILSLAKDKNFCGYFKKYQLVSLTNFGTTFGMGLVVVAFMVSQGFITGALVGVFGAIVGGAISTRIMQKLIRKKFPELEGNAVAEESGDENKISLKSEGSFVLRLLNAVLDGGKTGVEVGIAIIPGVLVICTLVMILTFGPSDSAVGYQGLAYEGVKLLPVVGDWFSPIFNFLFGFKDSALIAFPITSLGAVGAALSLVPAFKLQGIITNNEIAVFTAMGMCWSGFLSTHAAMLDVLGFRYLTPKAIFAHTIGGLCAGTCAHFAFVLVAQIFGIV